MMNYDHITLPSADIPVSREVDVLVIGGAPPALPPRLPPHRVARAR